jgi:endonuclease/exonuclease/phosphatase family metal-dependent hydrolase
MPKHAASRSGARSMSAAVVTAAAVGALGVLVALVATFQLHNPVEPAVADIVQPATSRAGAAVQAPASATPPAPQLVVQAQLVQQLPAVHRRPGHKADAVAAGALRRKVEEVVVPATSSFRIGTLNILGSNHTRGGHGRYGRGTDRAAISAGLIESRGIDVVGLQEVQDDQLVVLQNQLAGYGIWPMQVLGNNTQRLQVAWRESQFELVDTGSVDYVFSSQRIPLPWVRLRDRVDGGEFYVITTHNSAGGLEGERDAATSVEIALINELHSTGLPVYITGDMNEHEEFFCRAATEAQMTAANGGSGASGCVLPPRPRRVDWIMGTTEIGFSGYVQDGASLARASDHYLLYADTALSSPGTTIVR